MSKENKKQMKQDIISEQNDKQKSTEITDKQETRSERWALARKKKKEKRLFRSKEKTSRKKTDKRKKGCLGIIFSVLKTSTLMFVMASSIALLAAVLLINHELKDIPAVDAQYLKSYPTSEITDKDDNVIWKSTESFVETIEYDEIPEVYKDILIAVEDKEFWDSYGVSPKGMMNMVVGTVRSKIDSSHKARGGSTIDQQLIKNKYFDGGQGHNIVTRKIQELFLSLQLNQNFTKEEVLTFYVNDLEFAERSTGIKTIMKTYFGKTPGDYSERTPANIAEQAYLAGLAQAPTTYNLYTSPEEARKRTLIVLGIALEDEIITKKEYEDAKAHALEDNLKERGWLTKIYQEKNLKYKSYTDGAKKEIRDLGYDIDKLSVRIKTYLDVELYNQIENKVREAHYYLDSNQQVAVSVLNSDSVVVGMVGSRNSNDELNRATQTSRSTGSSTKPLLSYAPLLQYFGDRYNTASKFDTSSYRYPGSTAVMNNYGKGVYGLQTMHKSLVMSYNTPVGRIMDDILGSNRVSSFLSGIELNNKDTYTSVDGLGINASSLQVAAAYNTFNNLGEYVAPRFAEKITFSNGEEKIIEAQKRQAMNPSVAWTINHMLRSVPYEGGTAPTAKISKFGGYAAKTGTVGFDSSVKAPTPYGIGASDLWFNTYTNNGYSVSIWTGYDTPNTSPQLPSYYKKHQTLGRDLQLMLNERAPAVWDQPAGVVKISGEGRDAYYKVTDSSDNVFRAPAWTSLNSYNELNIKDVVGNEEVEYDWEDKENSEWFDYYKSGESLSPVIIDEELYMRMKGSE